MINEALFVLQEGPGQRCRHPRRMVAGMLALADMIGLDSLLAVTSVVYEEFKDSKYRAALLLREMVVAGWLGCRSCHGFYCC